NNLSGIASSTVNVTAANDAPMLSGAPTTVAFTENGAAVQVNASITLADADTASMTGATVTITNFVSGQDVLNFTNQNGITGGYNASTGVLTLSGSASVANYQAALRSITYSNTSEAPNTTTRSVSFAVSDGAASSNTFTTSVSVAAVNDAPTLDATKTPALAAVSEDATRGVGGGTLVASLVDFASPAGDVDNATDPDTGAQLGIAITGAASTNGTWYYSTDGGTTWAALGAVSDSNARLLAADASTRLFFEPNANFNGTVSPAITFRAWDRTSGSNGGTFDTTTNGDTTAFSSQTDTAAITINAVNDAPVGTDKTVWVDKNGS
ncbi:MAG TPA: hypothetical protein VEA16_13180, partial [Vicinamibacterales bacterium]|nr:hypothetical protein [Vicinamibacterales bacterium]